MVKHTLGTRLWRLPSVMLAATAMLVCFPRLAAGASDAVPPLTVMTYNLRFASDSPPNEWPVRRPLVREVITNCGPDVIGTQEGLYGQLRDLAADLPGYNWIGLGRDGGSRGEFMAVFYRTSRLEPVAFDHFWLSDTPEVMGSRTWGPKYARMVTWVRFRDRGSKLEFYLFNTHLDHEVQLARERSAELIRARVAGFETGLPVLLIGDFNAAAGTNRVHEILTGDGFFADAWDVASERRGEGIGTFNNFKAIEDHGPRIDWILSRGAVVVDRIETVSFQRDGQFPSDHFPVVARLRVEQRQ